MTTVVQNRCVRALMALRCVPQRIMSRRNPQRNGAREWTEAEHAFRAGKKGYASSQHRGKSFLTPAIMENLEPDL